ncbi:hypothetical protein J7E38_15645 [Bacillus sp. ISL-35]|uniref:hypothetical protein n=1 Tax=Bacillus sp. ISL-35 TaxID=2819122 RepID=UPI001BE7EDCD|nr:hypothetical protein [Bacillus sp. ISL-35]MBT2680444.1 hypothetical protein [Bacillus sp. ISL-35]MBT2704263.1 hypothetical protein [Chryseobacterium sp. ISL-80]
MRALVSFILLIIGGLLIGVTVENSLIGNSIVKGIGALCVIGFLKIVPRNKDSLS